jgi:hypothetical protein
MKNHPSLTSIDFSNSDSNKYRNKLGNVGTQALIEGIIQSSDSLISMINIAGNNITSDSICHIANLL